MKPQAGLLRVATYNVHKCCGLDRRVLPARIAGVLREISADVIALQEVLRLDGPLPAADQARFIAAELRDFDYCFGENRRLRGGAYGNLILSRLPLRAARNYDISWRGRERRGCLRADVDLGERGVVHLFNVHLGVSFLERRYQGRKLIHAKILNDLELAGPRVVLGDFNEWTRGLTSRLLAAHLESVDLRRYLRRSRTYPALLPLLHLDHVYYDPTLELKAFAVHRSRRALVASDHLPLVAEFRLPQAPLKKHPRAFLQRETLRTSKHHAFAQPATWAVCEISPVRHEHHPNPLPK